MSTSASTLLGSIQDHLQYSSKEDSFYAPHPALPQSLPNTVTANALSFPAHEAQPHSHQFLHIPPSHCYHPDIGWYLPVISAPQIVNPTPIPAMQPQLSASVPLLPRILNSITSAEVDAHQRKARSTRKSRLNRQTIRKSDILCECICSGEHVQAQPPRPMNKFMLFRHDLAMTTRATTKYINSMSLSKQAGQAWREAPDDVKRRYEVLAAEEKRKHQAAYPCYTYSAQKAMKTRYGTSACTCGAFVANEAARYDQMARRSQEAANAATPHEASHVGDPSDEIVCTTLAYGQAQNLPMDFAIAQGFPVNQGTESLSQPLSDVERSTETFQWNGTANGESYSSDFRDDSAEGEFQLQDLLDSVSLPVLPAPSEDASSLQPSQQYLPPADEFLSSAEIADAPADETYAAPNGPLPDSAWSAEYQTLWDDLNDPAFATFSDPGFFLELANSS